MRTFAVATGELLQRLREPGFILLLLVVSAGSTFLAPSPHAAYQTLSVGRSALYGGSGFAATSSGLDFGVLSGFFCIFALGGGLARDDRTRLSELLRAQPLRTLGLVGGRLIAAWALGSVLVLGAMLLHGITLIFREGAAFDPLNFARIFLVLALPSMWFVASLAVVLDVAVGRWRGWLVAAGIIGYLTVMSLGVGPAQGRHDFRTKLFDFAGVTAVQAELAKTFGSRQDFGAGLTVEDHPGKPIYWNGIAPDATTVEQRLTIVGLAAAIGLLAVPLYRRRAGVTLRGAQAIPGARGAAASGASVHAAAGRPLGLAGRVAGEMLLRVRKHPVLALASAGLFAFAWLGARGAHHWVIALGLLLPLFWIRVFDDSLRPRSLDETIACLPGGRSRDLAAKSIVLALLCALPLAGLLIGNPADPAVWLAATLGVLVEIAWLTAISWVARAELLALGVVALWWYVIAFNDVPAPLDYAGLWSAPALTFWVDGAIALAIVAAAQALVSRRAG